MSGAFRRTIHANIHIDTLRTFIGINIFLQGKFRLVYVLITYRKGDQKPSKKLTSGRDNFQYIQNPSLQTKNSSSLLLHL